ncbi:O-methyltransferase [Croceimicrobium hydrocarbonivorans]|uniref:Class I SAM-dependent methyltransferase n=1 Tax=Croceimicrobium hydrocarbonivorans TaxID=2761580 RepID=A0A7H0VGZ4_9FLAO|nr:O-methyltransferase [Croceimicrobium hydrocarbonivorans]QNR24992.1 class I SAM-dependent methyltransferase [Croceimicrobium hydrocarbonivorans]
MHFLDPKLEDYLSAHHDAEPELLAQLNRETHLKILQPRMLSGALQGRYLAMISKLARPKYILEIGTYTGYSALCLAEGLQEGGELHTLEINDELETMCKKYFTEAGKAEQIHLHIGDALDTLQNLKRDWDLIFIDADKPRYLDYYKLLIPSLKSGAFILADNVLWSGKVIEDLQPNDESTLALLEFNTFVQEDDRVENLLLPLRDGLMCIRVK